MAAILILTLCVYVGATAYIYLRLVQSLPTMPLTARIGLGVVVAFLAMAMFLAIGLRNVALPEVVHKFLFDAGSVWMVFMLYMTLSLIVADVAHLLFPALSGRVWYALGITLLVMLYGYINYRHPRIEHIDIHSEKYHAEKPLRIVAISDVHLGYGTDRTDLARYVDMINEQHPDIVFIVGDLIDNSIEPVRRDDMAAEFERLDAPLGIYAVLGNHEYISGLEACADYLATTPITLLRDSVVLLDDIAIVGRDDRMNPRRKPLAELLERADNKLTIVLDHQPYDIRLSDSLGVDIHLSGHTHRGQVWPLSWATDMMYDQSHGYRKWTTTHAYVSSGLSLWGPPFRVGTHSDMAVIDLHKKK